MYLNVHVSDNLSKSQ